MTAKRWLGTLARHYPSLLVSGVCHRALGEIEELERELQETVWLWNNEVKAFNEHLSMLENRLDTTITTLNHYAASDGLLAPLAAAVLAKIKENSK